MEKKNSCRLQSSNFAVQQLYNIKQRNYDWQSFKYVLPKKYSHNSSSNVRSGALFCTKKSYLDDLQKDKKTIPGPCSYKLQTNTLRPKSGKMDKAKKLTISQQVKQKCEKQNIPGPGAYFKRPNSADQVPASYQSKQQNNIKNHYLTEVEYLASMTPGVGMYSLNSPTHVGVPKLFKKARGVSRKDKQSDKQNAVNNQKFLNTVQSIAGSFEWYKLKQKKKDSSFFGKTKRFKTGSKNDRKPSPDSYGINNDWLSQNNVAKISTCSNLNLRSVYYH